MQPSGRRSREEPDFVRAGCTPDGNERSDLKPSLAARVCEIGDQAVEGRPRAAGARVGASEHERIAVDACRGRAAQVDALAQALHQLRVATEVDAGLEAVERVR